jgi:hypothetical protein
VSAPLRPIERLGGEGCEAEQGCEGGEGEFHGWVGLETGWGGVWLRYSTVGSVTGGG